MGLDIYFHKNKSKEIGYFRKVNFLVGFFSNVLDKEIENLHKVQISKEQVEELLDRCIKVLVDHSLAEELLPTYSGFFFGNYEYNEFYFKDVERVKTYIEKELLPEFKNLEPDEYITFEIWY